jgi:hypothetical protein
MEFKPVNYYSRSIAGILLMGLLINISACRSGYITIMVENGSYSDADSMVIRLNNSKTVLKDLKFSEKKLLRIPWKDTDLNPPQPPLIRVEFYGKGGRPFLYGRLYDDWESDFKSSYQILVGPVGKIVIR